MKVQAARNAPSEKRTSQDFKRALDALLKQSGKAAKSPRLPAGSVAASVSASAASAKAIASNAKASLASVDRLSNGRLEMHREGDRLEATAEGTRHQRRELESERGQALERRELRVDVAEKRAVPSGADRERPRGEERAEPSGQPLPTTATSGQVAPAAPPTPPEGVNLASALELVERIDAFVRSQRPGLALTVKGALEGRVEIERVGQNEVSVTLKTHSGAASLTEMARVRDALAERGLKIRQLRIG